MGKTYLKNLISIETLLPIGAILAISMVVLKLISVKTPVFAKYRKKFLMYSLVQVAIVAIFLLIIYNLKQSTVMLRYFSLMAYMAVAGALHVYFYRLLFERFESENYFKELGFAIVEAAFLVIPIILVASYFNDYDYMYNYFAVLAAFVFPTALYSLFNFSVAIPTKLYTKWYYPLDKKYEVPTHNELTNMIILNFLFYKNPEEPHLTSFKVKAPKNMQFGRLFYFFVNDYNQKKSANQIEMFHKENESYGWYFNTKPKWYGATQHINSELTVENNNLNDGDSVLCQRI